LFLCSASTAPAKNERRTYGRSNNGVAAPTADEHRAEFAIAQSHLFTRPERDASAGANGQACKTSGVTLFCLMRQQRNHAGIVVVRAPWRGDGRTGMIRRRFHVEPPLNLFFGCFHRVRNSVSKIYRVFSTRSRVVHSCSICLSPRAKRASHLLTNCLLPAFTRPIRN